MSCAHCDERQLLEWALGPSSPAAQGHQREGQRLASDWPENLAEHVAVCADCQAVLRELSPLADMLKGVRQATDVDFGEPVAAAILGTSRQILSAAATSGGSGLRMPGWTDPPGATRPRAGERIAGIAAMRPLRAMGAWLGRYAWPLAAGLMVTATVALWRWRVESQSRGVEPWQRVEMCLGDGAGEAAYDALQTALTELVGHEINSSAPDVETIAHLETAIWAWAVAAQQNSGDPPQANQSRWANARQVVRWLVDQARYRHQSRQANAPDGLHGQGALAPPMARGELTGRLQRAWEFRSANPPDWLAAARCLTPADPSPTPGDLDEAHQWLIAGLYHWRAGGPTGREAAMAALSRAMAADANLGGHVAYVARWGLGNPLKAAYALLGVVDEVRLRALVMMPGWGAGLPLLIFPSPDTALAGLGGVASEDWWVSGREPLAVSVDDPDGSLRSSHAPHDWVEILTRVGRYLQRDGDYTVQTDFCMEASAYDDPSRAIRSTPTAMPAVPCVALLGHWTQTERQYRLVVTSGGEVGLVKRYPAADDAAPSDHDEQLPTVGEVTLARKTLLGPNAPLANSVWWTAKLRVERGPQPGQVRLSGKVWRRDDPEPPQWLIVTTDTGQHQGQPGGSGVWLSGRAGLAVRGCQARFAHVLIAAHR